MKKVLWIAVTGGMVGLFTGCAPKTEAPVEPAVQEKVTAEEQVKTGDQEKTGTQENAGEQEAALDTAVAGETVKPRIIVAYFSASGVTRGVAETLAESTGGTLYEIVPEAKYTDDDLNWRNEQSRSSVEMKDPASRPAIVGKVENFGDYGIVFLGYPIWWNVAPHVINTFIESHDMAGKTVVPFCTAGSSGIENSVSELRKVLPQSKVVDGKKLYSGATLEEVSSWVKSLELGIETK